jgi:Zn-finger nucleic acid-binding protein
MKCPNCESTLVMSERHGVEIDHCPQCRGVWLDRGELDKIIERSASYDERAPRRESRDDDRDHRAHPGGDGYQRYPKRKSFWAELFD